MRFLVAVDQFPQGEMVLRRAFDLARKHGARLTILHVLDGIGPVLAHELSPAMASLIRDDEEKDARERIDAAIAACDPAGVDWTLRLQPGAPAETIVDAAKAGGARLIILGAHQRRSFLDKLLGSTTDRVVRTAPVPVLVVKRPFEASYRRALAAVDFSDHALAAADMAVELCPGADIQLVNVAGLHPQLEQALLRTGGGFDKIRSLEKRVADKARRELRDFASRYDGRIPAPAPRVVAGDASLALSRLTWRPRVDLIAVGRRGRPALVEALLGGVTQHLLRDAACDVLVVQAEQAA